MTTTISYNTIYLDKFMERMMIMCNIAVQIPEEVVYDTKMNITETQNFIKQ